MASTTVGDAQRLHMAVPIKQPYIWPYLTNWLGGYPLKVEIRFRIPLGLQNNDGELPKWSKGVYVHRLL